MQAQGSTLKLANASTSTKQLQNNSFKLQKKPRE